MPDLQAARAGRRVLRINALAIVLAGIALGLTAVGRIAGAVTVIFLVLLAVIASLETLRVLVLSDRESRR